MISLKSYRGDAAVQGLWHPREIHSLQPLNPLPSYLLNLQSLLLQDMYVVCFQRDVFYLLTNYYAVVFNAVTTCIFLKMFLIAFFLLAIFVITGFRNVLLGCALSALFSFWEWNQYISSVSFPCVNLCKATIGLDQLSRTLAACCSQSYAEVTVVNGMQQLKLFPLAFNVCAKRNKPRFKQFLIFEIMKKT